MRSCQSFSYSQSSVAYIIIFNYVNCWIVNIQRGVCANESASVSVCVCKWVSEYVRVSVLSVYDSIHRFTLNRHSINALQLQFQSILTAKVATATGSAGCGFIVFPCISMFTRLIARTDCFVWFFFTFFLLPCSLSLFLSLSRVLSRNSIHFMICSCDSNYFASVYLCACTSMWYIILFHYTY